MANKQKTRFNPVFQDVLDFVTSNVTVDRDEVNGLDVKHKKKVKDVCIHMMLNRDGDPKNMIEENDVKKTAHCMVCDREFPLPDISQENLKKIHETIGILNGTVLLFPWSTIGKKDATLAIETRNALEQYAIMYEGALNDISTAKSNSAADLSLKTHTARL